MMMKGVLLFLLCLISSWALGQTQRDQTISGYIPFPTSPSHWNITNVRWCWPLGSGTGRWYYSICYNGDTVAGNQTYKKLDIPLFQTDPTTPPGCSVSLQAGYVGALRQDTANRKVYFLPPNHTQEQLLYDFSISVGDTLKGYMGSTSIYRVVNVDEIVTFDGQTRKRWNMKQEGCPVMTVQFIEGVGSTMGLLSRPVDCVSDAAVDSLMCMSVSGNTQYQNPGVSSCYLITDSKTLVSNPTFTLNPNPAEEFITLKTEQPVLSFTVTDALGRPVGAENFLPLPTGNRLNISGFSPGLYTLKIQTAEGTAVQRVVKK